MSVIQRGIIIGTAVSFGISYFLAPHNRDLMTLEAPHQKAMEQYERYYAHTGKVELGIEDAKFATARKAQIQALALAEATKSE